MGSDGDERELSPAEEQLCDLLQRYDESLAAGAADDPGDATPQLSPELISESRQGQEILDLLNRAFTPLPSSTESSASGTSTYRGESAADVADEGAPLPRQVGRFHVWLRIGCGGIGIVYQAYDPTVGRIVALKIPRPESLVSSDLRRRFLREAEAAGRLCHRGIVTVYEVGELGAICYLATEYCDGPTLAAWLAARTEPVPARQAAELVAALAEAVQHAHSRGVLHRDIKPTNVLLDLQPVESSAQRPTTATSGTVVPKLADFGMAKLLEYDGPETRPGAIIGTPEYMSPEQAQGRSADLAATTDIYALGVLLYQILTGNPPFQGTTAAATLHRVVYEEPRAAAHPPGHSPRPGSDLLKMPGQKAPGSLCDRGWIGY